MYFKNEGDLIYLIGKNGEELGSSEYLEVKEGKVDGYVPQLDLNLEKRVQKTVREAIKENIINSAHDCSEGGLAVNLAESCFENNLGVNIEINKEISNKALLFGESQSRIIVSISKKIASKLENIAVKNCVPYEKIGVVEGNQFKFNNLIKLDVEEMKAKWETAIEENF